MKRKLKQMRPAAAYVIAILAFVLICFVVGRIPTGDSVSQPEGDSAQSDTSGIPWNLILVTNDLALPEDFSVQLATLSDYRNEQVDARILQDLTTMLNDMEQAGLEPLVCSSYRDYNRQMQLFNQERDEFTQQGMDAEEAYAAAMQNVALPGYSEHETGLALDIVSVSHQTLDEAFAETPEGQWLAANSAQYGFVVRYTADKQEITGITYEPWHLRYVGRDAALAMQQQNLCLEEYLIQQGYIQEVETQTSGSTWETQQTE